MATQSTTIQLRIDKKTKKEAQAIMEKLGMDLSSGIKAFIAKVVSSKSIPFVIRTENGFTPEYEKALWDELKRMKNGEEITFKSAKDAIKYLNE